MTVGDNQPLHPELPVSGEGTARWRVDESSKPTSPGSEGDRNDKQNINSGHTTIYSISNFVVDGGSVMNGRIANIGGESRQRPKQNNQRPVVRKSGSLEENACVVENIRNGAEDPAPMGQMNHVNIGRGAKFVNHDLSADEFLKYFCGKKT